MGLWYDIQGGKIQSIRGHDVISHTTSGWWFGCHFLFSQKYWESHHPNWLIFFRGVAQPPTSTYKWWIFKPCSTLPEGNYMDNKYISPPSSLEAFLTEQRLESDPPCPGSLTVGRSKPADLPMFFLNGHLLVQKGSRFLIVYMRYLAKHRGEPEIITNIVSFLMRAVLQPRITYLDVSRDMHQDRPRIQPWRFSKVR